MSSQTPHQPGPDDTVVRDRAALPPRPSTEKKRSRSHRPVIIAVVATVVGLLGLAYLVGYLMAGDRLPKDARISGVAVGGLDRSAAVLKLTNELGPRVTEPVEAVAGGKPTQIDPVAAGLGIDYEASVDAAGGGRSVDPRHIFRVLTGGSDTDAVLQVDEEKLAGAVQGLSRAVDQQPVDATIAYRGTKVVTGDAQPGITLQPDAAAESIRTSLFSGVRPLELAADVVEPAVTDAEVAQVVDTFAKPAVSARIKVKAGGAGSFRVAPEMLAEAIEFPVADGTIAPTLNAEKLRSSAASVVSKVELTKPRNATVRLVKGKPKVIAAVDGTTVTADALKNAVEPALTKTGKGRTVSVQLSGNKARFSTADAKKLGIKRVTGRFTTYFPYLPYRNINIGRAAELINGTVLKPGDTFSLNKVVGERTKANGFTEGFIIRGGKFKKELGGGVSQSATTTYNAMFFAGLKDIEHQPHTLYIDRYPPGREATVAWPSLDLKFQNDTDYGVLVQAYLVKGTPSRRGSLTVKMWSTKTYDKVTSTTPVKSNFTSGTDIKDDSSDCEPMTPVQGFDADYQRLFYRDGAIVKREKFHWRYAPTNKVTCTR